MEVYHKNARVDRSKPRFELFDGLAPVRMLPSLTTLRDKFDTIGVSEPAAVQVLAHFLGGAASHVLPYKFTLNEIFFEAGCKERRTKDHWPLLSRRFWEAFSPKKCFRAHDAVAGAEKIDSEDDGQLSKRICINRRGFSATCLFFTWWDVEFLRARAHKCSPWNGGPPRQANAPCRS